MLHCYLDTDIELKDVKNFDYLNPILENICADISKVINLI